MIISDNKKIKVQNYGLYAISANKVVIVKGKTIVLANPTDPEIYLHPLAITLQYFEIGSYGEVLLAGTLDSIDTTVYSNYVNTSLYLAANGGISSTVSAVTIGSISKLSNTGSVYVNFIVEPSIKWGDITGNIADQTDLGTAFDAKQDTLVSGTNIKTINGSSILGAGDLTVTGTGGGISHGVTSGTDTYTTTISGVGSLNDGDAFLIRFTTGNTTSCTLNINSLGAIPLYRNNDGQLIGGDIIDGAEMLCIYNSTLSGFQVIGTAPNTLLSYVTNAESTTITKGQPVYAFGGQGDRLKVKLAYNTSDATSAQTVGIVLSTSIAANQKGLIIVNGQLDGLNIFPTSTWADGDAVYLGATAGSVTKTKPVAPNHLVYLGFVTTASNGSAGRMYVRVQNGYELDELHDAQVGSYGTLDVLWRDTATNLWKNKDIFTLIGPASGSANGYLTSGDWSIFNGKQPQLNGTGFVKATGTTISYDNTSYYPVSNPANFTSYVGTVTSIATTSPILGGTITSSGTISIQQSTTTTDGYLSSGDWNTFKNKQDTITGGASTIVSSNLTASRVLVSDGSGKVAANTVTTTTLGYLDATSSIQTQLDSKLTVSRSFMAVNQNGTIAASTTTYGSFILSGFNTAELSRIFVVPYACTMKNFYVRMFAAQPASGSLVFTVRKNQADTAVVVTIAAGSAANTEANSGITTATFAAGDDCAIKIVNSATGTSGTVNNTSIMIEI